MSAAGTQIVSIILALQQSTCDELVGKLELAELAAMPRIMLAVVVFT